MTPQEQQMLQGLIDRVRNTQIAEKDADAERLLQSGLGSNPDSLYVLAQTVLVQQYALSRAQQQLSDLRAQNQQLQQQVAEPPRHTSFLGALLGHNEPERQPPPPPRPSVSAGPGPAYTPVPSYPGVAPGSVPPFGQPGYGYAAPPGGGFLRSALQTATGVAAGALAFQGIEDLMHGFGHAAGYGTEFAPMPSGPREEVINNYYGEANPAGSGSEHSGSFLPDLNQASGTGQGGSGNDIWNTPSGESSGGKADDIWNSSNDTSGQNDVASTDTAAMDAMPFDDTSGSDPGAGLDDNAGDDGTSGGEDQGSLSDDPAGSFDGSGSGVDDPSGGFDDGGSGFDSGDSGGF